MQLLQELYKNEKSLHEEKAAKTALNEIEHNINQHVMKSTESSIFRSRCNWIQNGEVPSKMFFSLEKKNYLAKNMKCVYRDNGQLTYDQKEILDEQTRYYKKLYTAEGHIKFNIVRKEHDPKITDIQKTKCESELCEGEIFDALLMMKANKVGGPDGFTAEFYRRFYKYLKQPLLNMYNYAFKKGILPLCTRSGLISLLPKKDKNTKYVKNMHPLTLLNIEYKILAKVMDNRLKEILPDIIHEDQTGFMSGRHITCQVRKSLDVIQYCKNTQTPAIIFSIDMEKCFDKIAHSSIYGALHFLGFGENYIKWISLFYTQFRVCTQNFGFRSNWFFKTRSVNQGCNISPSIFLLTGELLAIRLRQNTKIKGIKIGDTELLISQFADDMDLYLPYDKTVLNEVLRELQYIENCTGLTVNYNKTTLYRIGSIANSDAKLHSQKKSHWSNEYINTLGIDLHQEDLDKNFDKVIMKMRTISNLWFNRHLTLMGKVLLVNSLFASLFVYKMQTIHYISDNRFQEAEWVISEFLWSGKKAKIPMKILTASKYDGGLGLVDLRAKHMSLLIKSIHLAQNHPQLHELAAYFCGIVNMESITKANLNVKDSNLVLPGNNYWSHVFRKWLEITYHEPQNKDTVLRQRIEYNSMLKIENRVIKNKLWHQSGIVTLQDIWNNDKERFFLYSEITEIAPELPWMDYYSLISAIPHCWKFLLTRDNLKDNREFLEDHLNHPHLTKIIYCKIIEVKSDSMTNSAHKIQKMLQAEIDWNSQKNAFKHIYSLTNIDKLRNFQFRLLHNKIFCNDVLFHWKKVDMQRCDFCTEPKQTVMHLLWHCDIAQRIWKEVMYKITENTKISIQLSTRNILYNRIHKNANGVINFIVLITKHFIFRSKCQNVKPTSENLYKEINLYYMVEKYIASRNDKVRKFKLKWAPVLGVFTPAQHL